MINTNIYNYINVLDKAADAANTRNEIITNNLANVDTPNYKRKDVYKFLPKVRGGAQRAEGSVERLTSRDSFRATPEPHRPPPLLRRSSP